MMALPSLIGMTPDQLRDAVVAAGGKPFNAKQLAKWLYGRRETDIAKMSDLPKGLRKALSEKYCTLSVKVISTEESGENTTKLALQLQDGSVIEAVLMRSDEDSSHGAIIDEREDWPEEMKNADVTPILHYSRCTACISTQAGCAMGCRFCASGMLGLKRHLTAGEILEQLYLLNGLLTNEAIRHTGDPSTLHQMWLDNVVVMGMGEPLHNFDNLMMALNILNADWGFKFGARRITVSTVGLPDKIRELAKQGMQFNLAISLHATTDEQRTRLIPTNIATGLKNIIEAAADYFKETRREVTFEYTLVGGENDTKEDALRLVELLRGFPRANVNLIPMNPVEGSGLKAPTLSSIEEFKWALKRAGINVHERKKRGRAVQAACGQLRLRLQKSEA